MAERLSWSYHGCVYWAEIRPDVLRQMRIHLWRIHNEREVLRVVLSECLQRHLDPSYPALRDYLARQSATLRQSYKEGLPQASLLAHAYALDGLVNSTEIAELGEILRDVSPGLAASVMPLAASNDAIPPSPIFITVNGDMQVAETIDYGESQHIHGAGDLGAVIGGRAAVAGRSFHGSGSLVTQVLHGMDLGRLADELDRLGAELRESHRGQGEQADIERIQQAEMAARSGRRHAVIQHLARTSKWVQEVAAQVGADLVVAAIKAMAGIG